MGFKEDAITAMVPAAIGFAGQERANMANAKQALSQQAFQERMAGTEWQRGVADMKAAGLNPALAYDKGGASSPGGAMAKMEDSLGKGVSNAMESLAVRSRIATDRANQEAAMASAEKARQEARTTDVSRKLVLQNLVNSGELSKASARESHQRWTRGAIINPLEYSLLREELEEGRPLLREIDRNRRDHYSASAREVEQRIKLTDRMTPDEWSASLQRNWLPFTRLIPGVR